MAKAAKFRPPELRKNGILARARKEAGWSAARAAEAEKWYRRHLQIAYERGGKPVYIIHRDADHLWHTHITFTKAYRNYTTRVFGHYLDHTPLVPPAKPPSAAQIAAGKREYSKREWPLERVYSGTGCH